MKAKDVKEQVIVKPVKEGLTGMYLSVLPELVSNDKNGKVTKFVRLKWVHAETGNVFPTVFFNPYTPSEKATVSQIEAGFLKYFRLAKSYMTEAKYDQFAELDLETIEDLVNTINQMIDPSWPNVETTLMVGFSKYDGQLGLPAFEPYISTTLNPRDLEMPTSMSVFPVDNPTKDAKGGGTKPDKEVATDNDEV